MHITERELFLKDTIFNLLLKTYPRLLAKAEREPLLKDTLTKKNSQLTS